MNSKKTRSQWSGGKGGTSAPDKTEIAAIDKLLNTASELMNRTRGIDKQAYEYLRRLRVTVRFALSASEPENFDYPPLRAPKNWAEREDKSESPIDFINREYAPWLANKSISRADIRKLDRQLYTALYNWIAKHGDISASVDLPKLSQANERKLRAAGPKIKSPNRLRKVSELPMEEREQLRLYKLAQRRKAQKEK